MTVESSSIRAKDDGVLPQHRLGRAGSYYVRVASSLEDVCGKSLLEAFDRPLRWASDLVYEVANRSIPFHVPKTSNAEGWHPRVKTWLVRNAAVMFKLLGMGERQAVGSVRVCPRFRVMRGEEIALGPGRVQLLELIGQTGSLRAAALRMGVSYMRAWNLVKDTNKCFTKPLVETTRGGRTRGGAILTRSGREVVVKYREMEAKTRGAVKQSWGGIKRLLKT